MMKDMLMNKLEFEKLVSEPCVFTHHDSEGVMDIICGTHVDDTLTCGRKSALDWFHPLSFQTSGVVCAMRSVLQPELSDHDRIMCVWCKQNDKEVNSKCGNIASSLIVRITILGGIGVIQHT